MSVLVMAADAESVQDPGGVVVAGGCNAGILGKFQDPDGQVPRAALTWHRLPDTDLRRVFAVGDVAEVVEEQS
jgi:hypothetical protein